MTSPADSLPLAPHDSRRAPPFPPGNRANPSGRPRIALPHDALDVIERLTARGVAQYDIARALGMSVCTFRERKRADARIVEALQRAREQRRTASHARGLLRGKAQQESGSNVC